LGLRYGRGAPADRDRAAHCDRVSRRHVDDGAAPFGGDCPVRGSRCAHADQYAAGLRFSENLEDPMRGLPISTRLQLAKKALTGLFKPEDIQAAQGLLTGIFRGASGTYPERHTAELLNAFNTHPWAHRCARRVADAIRATHWHLYVARAPSGQPVPARGLQRAGFHARQKMLKQAKEDGAVTEIENHILLDLLREGNTEFAGPDLWWLHSIFLDLIGDAFYIKQRNALGAPVALWPIPPNWVINTPTPTFLFYKVSYRGFVRMIPQT